MADQPLIQPWVVGPQRPQTMGTQGDHPGPGPFPRCAHLAAVVGTVSLLTSPTHKGMAEGVSAIWKHLLIKEGGALWVLSSPTPHFQYQPWWFSSVICLPPRGQGREQGAWHLSEPKLEASVHVSPLCPMPSLHKQLTPPFAPKNRDPVTHYGPTRVSGTVSFMRYGQVITW